MKATDFSIVQGQPFDPIPPGIAKWRRVSFRRDGIFVVRLRVDGRYEVAVTQPEKLTAEEHGEVEYAVQRLHDRWTAEAGAEPASR